VVRVGAAAVGGTSRLKVAHPPYRLIAATAMVEGAPLVTADERIRQAKVVQTVW